MLVRHNNINSNEHANPNASLESGEATPGAMLQAARIQKGLNEQEVAEQLHLSQRWIKDIETNAFSRAPALIYMRGYLRAYARLVDIPPHEVLAAFDAMGWSESEAVDEQEWLRSMGEKARKERIFQLYRYLGWGFIGVVIVVILSLLVLWWIHTAKHSTAGTSTIIRPPTSPHASKALPKHQQRTTSLQDLQLHHHRHRGAALNTAAS